jgi:hypothetical protein
MHMEWSALAADPPGLTARVVTGKPRRAGAVRPIDKRFLRTVSNLPNAGVVP